MDVETKVKHWHELSEEEKKVISDERDYPIISVIDGLSVEERRKFYGLIIPRNLLRYNLRQQEWISIFTYFLDQNLKKNNMDHSPEVIQNLLLEEMIHGITHERFRLYYAARYGDDVFYLKQDRELADFLNEVDIAIELSKSKSQSK